MRHTRRHRRGERGATVVEAAIVLPTMIALLFGMLEMGLFFKDSLTLDEAAKDGAHIGAVYAQDSSADYYIVQKIMHASLNGTVQKIIVYDAGNPNPSNLSAENVPASCTALASGGVTQGYYDSNNAYHQTGGIGSCNVYSGSDFAQPLSWYQSGCLGCSDSQYWPGNVRLQNTTDTRYAPGNNVQAGPGPDLLGVWVQTTHNWSTGLVATGATRLTSQAVFRIEPRQ